MKKDDTQEILRKLEQGVKDVFSSGKFEEYLKIMSKFHNYSFNNSLMIMFQNPEATHIAGYTTWKQLGRQVVKGAKAIKILAPSIYKKEIPLINKDTKEPALDKNGEPLTETKKLLYFKPVNVFDISQTEGKELPQLITELTGNVEEKRYIFTALSKLVDMELQEKEIEGGAKGYFKPQNPLTDEPAEIVINSGMSDLQSIKTAIHETAHCLLHDPLKEVEEASKNKRGQEVEAESVAFVVATKLGLDTSDYSFTYVAAWSATRELDELKQSLTLIQKTAEVIYTEIEKELKLIKETELDKDAAKPKLDIKTRIKEARTIINQKTTKERSERNEPIYNGR